MTQGIEVLSSSPEPQIVIPPPRPKRRGANLRRAERIIDIADSDDDVPLRWHDNVKSLPLTTSPSRTGAREMPQAGPSNLRPNDAQTKDPPGRNLTPFPLLFPDDHDALGLQIRHAHLSDDRREEFGPMTQAENRDGPPAIESTDTYVARVLEIIPDVQPDHVHSLVVKHH